MADTPETNDVARKNDSEEAPSFVRSVSVENSSWGAEKAHDTMRAVSENAHDRTRRENEDALLLSDRASGSSSDLAGRVVRLVDESLHKSNPSPADEELLHKVEGLGELLDEIAALREFSLALARGELHCDTRHKGVAIGALKALQANLRHLTWQAQRIASGELDVRVNFLGQFSDAFNSMTEQLKDTLEEKDKLAAKYKALSDHDSLTGLLNRSAFAEAAARLLGGELCRRCSSSLIMSDIDHFKRINDDFGHQCGDEVLRRVAEVFRENLRQEDVVCRYGGEEFLILAPCLELESARRIAERLADALREMSIIWKGRYVRVTASFGVSPLPPVGEEGFSLRFLREYVQIADLNLYRAKREGRDRVVCGELFPEDLPYRNPMGKKTVGKIPVGQHPGDQPLDGCCSCPGSTQKQNA